MHIIPHTYLGSVYRFQIVEFPSWDVFPCLLNSVAMLKLNLICRGNSGHSEQCSVYGMVSILCADHIRTVNAWI